MGPNYDPAIIATLQVGTPKTEVITQLGRPSATATLPDGRQQLMWTHSRGTMLGTAQARSVMLLFGADGRYLGMVSQAETDIR